VRAALRARSRAVVRSGGVLGELACEPPLTLRRVHGRPEEVALCLVGSAAGPLPGDDQGLTLCLEPDARASLQATGAGIAQGRGGPAAVLTLTAELGERAVLDADPGALVVCAGARVDVRVHLSLGTGATVRWRELMVLGRTHDATAGDASVRWDVVRDGRPVLRQHVDLAEPFAAHRVLATELLSGPDVSASTRVLDPTAVAQRIDEHTELRTVLGSDAADVVARLGLLQSPRE